MFSLYRGELHNVSGVPRQWTIPKSQIPVSVFKKALVKRNAALSKLSSQPSSSGQKATECTAPAAPTANGTGGHHTSESDDDSGDFEERDGAENSSDSGGADSRPENAVGYAERNVAASNEETKAVAEERGRRRERKRRREQDLRDETGRCAHRKEDLATADATELDASELELRANSHGAEPMVVDDLDQSGAMECDATVSEKAVTDTDEANAEVRVRVPEAGDMSELDATQADPGTGDTRELKQKDVEHPRRNGEILHPTGAGADISGSEKLRDGAGQIVPAAAVQNGGTGAADVAMVDVEPNRKAELEAKLEKLRAEKHRFVLRLKRVLNEEETKKRENLASASPKGAASGHNDTPGVVPQVEGHGGGGARAPADLEDGELEYARTPSPPSRNVHGGATGSHSSLGPSPMAPGTARQGFLPQHSSQSTTTRGGYYIPNVGISPSTSAAVGASGALSPSLPSPSGSRPYSHNLGMQPHAPVMYGQKVSPGAHGHAQFNAMQSSGTQAGVTPPGVAGGPPGFSGYPMTSSVHSHHSHQQASSPHIAAGQQAVGSSPLLSNPRGPPSYHDVRMGGGAWIQR